MLILNNQILNLSEPKKAIEVRIAKELKDLIEKYKLEEGNTVSIVYPKEYFKPNKHNPGKPFKPASFKISFRDVVRGNTGTEQWRWASGVDTNKEGDVNRYYPTSHMFNGSWQFGLAEADLLYFLVNFSSRLKGGKNDKENKRPYMEIENKVGDAEAFAATIRMKAFIDSTIFDPEKLSDKKLVEYAKLIGINNAETEVPAILRKTVHSIISADKKGHEKLKAFLAPQAKPKADLTEFSDLVAKAIADEKIEFADGKWIWANNAHKGTVLCATKNSGEKPEDQLAVFLSKSATAVEAINAALAE